MGIMGILLTIFAIAGLINVLTGGEVEQALNDASAEHTERRERQKEIELMTHEKLVKEREMQYTVDVPGLAPAPNTVRDITVR